MADQDADRHADQHEAPAPRPPADVVDEWQRRAWGDCDLAAVDELIGEPYVRHGMTGTAKRTHAELKHDLGQYHKALGKALITVHDRAVDGDRVWSRTTMRGANMLTGEPRTIQWLQIHRVADGRIVEVWTLNATDVDWDAAP